MHVNASKCIFQVQLKAISPQAASLGVDRYAFPISVMALMDEPLFFHFPTVSCDHFSNSLVLAAPFQQPHPLAGRQVLAAWQLAAHMTWFLEPFLM